MFNLSTHNLEGKIEQTTSVLAKLVAGDAKEAFPNNEKFSYADLKSIVQRLSNSDKFMKELVVIPMGFGMQAMPFMGAQGPFTGHNQGSQGGFSNTGG
jgi:hypothetical protein